LKLVKFLIWAYLFKPKNPYILFYWDMDRYYKAFLIQTDLHSHYLPFKVEYIIVVKTTILLHKFLNIQTILLSWSILHLKVHGAIRCQKMDSLLIQT